MSWTDPLPSQSFPEQRVALVRICNLHPVDLYENEIIQLLRLHAGI